MSAQRVPVVKVTVNLPEQAMLEIRALAVEQGTTVTTQMKRALALHLLVERKRSEGFDLVINHPKRDAMHEIYAWGVES